MLGAGQDVMEPLVCGGGAAPRKVLFLGRRRLLGPEDAMGDWRSTDDLNKLDMRLRLQQVPAHLVLLLNRDEVALLRVQIRRWLRWLTAVDVDYAQGVVDRLC